MRAPGFAEDALPSLPRSTPAGRRSPRRRRRCEAPPGGIHNAYGLTETTSPLTLIAARLGRARSTPPSGALSVGVPVYDTVERILDDDGQDAAPRRGRRDRRRGPQVVPGYWGKPDETAHALPGGAPAAPATSATWTRDGWVYLVDRSKDHDHRRRATRCGRARSRTSSTSTPRCGRPRWSASPTPTAARRSRPTSACGPARATPDELIAFCRERMAAYKYPREVELLDELPKSPTGKILRRTLRERAATEA